LFANKVVLLMGEPMVNAFIKVFDMFTLFAKECVKDQFSDIKESVMDSIKGMLITKVMFYCFSRIQMATYKALGSGQCVTLFSVLR